MTKQDLIKIIQYDLTAYGNLPVSLDDEDISKMIDIEMDMLYRIYNELIENQYAIINRDHFYTEEFTSGRQIKFPDCVIGIKQFREISQFHSAMGMYGYGDMLGGGTYAGGMYLSPWSTDGVTYRMTRLSTYDLYRQLHTTAIQFTFSQATHTIAVTGRTPRRDVLIEAICCIPLADAYSDPYVRKYLCAKAKIQLARIIGLYNAQLVGGVSINVAMINEDAKQDITDCETYFKEINTPSYFVMF